MTNYLLSATRTLFVFMLGVGMTLLAYKPQTVQSCSVAGCAITDQYEIERDINTSKFIGWQDGFSDGIKLVRIPDTVYVVDTVKVGTFVIDDDSVNVWIMDSTSGDEIIPISVFTGLTTVYSRTGERIILSDADKWAPFEKSSGFRIDTAGSPYGYGKRITGESYGFGFNPIGGPMELPGDPNPQPVTCACIPSAIGPCDKCRGPVVKR